MVRQSASLRQMTCLDASDFDGEFWLQISDKACDMTIEKYSICPANCMSGVSEK